MKGIIALDIDGTLTEPGNIVPLEVAQYLKQLEHDKWQLVFVTGRPYNFGFRAIEQFSFPYFFVVQNGAITLEMPSHTIVNKQYLDKNIIPIMEKICEDHPSDFIIYTGFEHRDQCYYRSHYFSDDLLEYLKARTAKFQETWHDVSTFDKLDIDAFPSVKCFGLQESAIKIAQQIEDELGLHVPLIRDPFNFDYFVAQATHPDVNKGNAVQQLQQFLNNGGPIIAAGDDYNDLPLLEIADIKIVMKTAPRDMHASADVIAPPASEHGIIQGLTTAIEALKKR